MRYGVCGSLEMIGEAEAYNYDYMEISASAIAAMDETEYKKTLETVNASRIKCEAFNILFGGNMNTSGTMNILGEDADYDKVSEYVKVLFPRLKRLGAQVVVFGSGGVRRYPENFSRERAYEQLVRISRMLGAEAYGNGFIVVVEPLCKAATNMINSMAEGRALVEDACHPSFLLLADWYHCKTENETGADVRSNGMYLRHTHIAHPGSRLNPGENDGGDYEDFFQALADIGYNLRLSYEGINNGDFRNYAGHLLEYLKGLEQKAVSN
ncbi:MAG: sugar phosphate isomerase/epimerase [Oscillospiraceae bacterium]|jgi:sugar phosphate isomerase/epimerase|nr:sugar phosphate isomerase/epimerase [Oscillospiraceae bacterium]